MNETLQNLMRSATKLTQTGRLSEATAAIQRALRGMGALPTRARPEASAVVLEGCVFEADAPAPAAKPSAHAAFISGSHTHALLTRAYKLFVAPGRPERPRALVVMLHGCTQDPDDFAAGTGMNDFALEQGFVVLYPAQAQDANPSRCWNWFKHNHQQRGHGEAAVLAGMTRAVIAEHGLDARRVYVAGLSAGGAMAAILGHAYADIYAAVGIHSGLASGAAGDLMSALAAMKNGPITPTSAPGPAHRGEPGNAAIGALAPLPTIVFHGDGDAVVHPGNGTQAIAAALGASQPRGSDAAEAPMVEQGVSAQGRRYTRTVYARAEGKAAQAEHWVVHGGGHAWSGGSTQGSYTDLSGPDATREMWRFFSDHIASIS